MRSKPDWASLKAEYIGGGISQRELAQKHNVSETTLMKKAAAEGWRAERDAAYRNASEKAQQKTASAAAENAVILQRIRRKLLLKLENEVESLPDNVGSESSVSVRVGTETGTTVKSTVWNLKQLAGAYQDLCAEDFKREKLELERQKSENENW